MTSSDFVSQRTVKVALIVLAFALSTVKPVTLYAWLVDALAGWMNLARLLAILLQCIVMERVVACIRGGLPFEGGSIILKSLYDNVKRVFEYITQAHDVMDQVKQKIEEVPNILEPAREVLRDVQESGILTGAADIMEGLAETDSDADSDCSDGICGTLFAAAGRVLGRTLVSTDLPCTFRQLDNALQSCVKWIEQANDVLKRVKGLADLGHRSTEMWVAICRTCKPPLEAFVKELWTKSICPTVITLLTMEAVVIGLWIMNCMQSCAFGIALASLLYSKGLL
jgi:hypothetical protein